MSKPSEQSLELAREFRDNWNIEHGSNPIPLPVQALYEIAALLDEREATVRQEQHEATARLCAANCSVQLKEDDLDNATAAVNICIGIAWHALPPTKGTE